MKKIKAWLKSFMAIPYMKYVVVVVAGIAIIGFLGSNSVLAHFRYKMQISELKEEIQHYEQSYQRDQEKIHQLENDPKAMEEIARERYFMKTADEDIFVLSSDRAEDEQQAETYETAE